MGCKVVVAVFGIAFLAIALHAHENQPSLQNAVEDLIQKLLEIVRNLSDEAYKQFTNAFNIILSLAKDIIDGISSAANDIIGPIIDTIKRISQDALDRGIDISECAVDEAIQELTNLPGLFLHQIEHCVDAIVDSGRKILNEGKDTIEKILNKVEDLAQDASKCGLIDPVCWGSLAAKVAEASVQIPIEITAATTKTVQLIIDLKLSIVKCKTDNLLELGSEAQKILSNVTECVTRQIHKLD